MDNTVFTAMSEGATPALRIGSEKLQSHLAGAEPKRGVTSVLPSVHFVARHEQEKNGLYPICRADVSS